MSSKEKLKVGITIGDPNGVGPEIILKTFNDTRMLDLCSPIIYGSSNIFSHYLDKLEFDEFRFNNIVKAEEASLSRVNLLNCISADVLVEEGKSSKEAGKIAFESLKAATEDIASNKIDVLVTCPINKSTIQSEEFIFPGHTEYLANYANEDNPLMIMVTEEIKIGLVSIHIPLKDVAKSITTEGIVIKANTLYKSLQQDFCIQKPKLAILSLNPHAGDNGLLGDEEQQIILPAINQLSGQGILAFGPFATDGFFGSSLYKKYDGILAMYHDQGLAPFKALTFDEGVNFTAGLPIVRTSPDHGVGYDIAGKNIASENSFRNAIYLACDVYKRRRNYKTLVANQLVVQKD